MKKFVYVLIALAAVVALSSCKCKSGCGKDDCKCEKCECTTEKCNEGCCGEEKPCCKGENPEGCDKGGSCDKAEGCTETPTPAE